MEVWNAISNFSREQNFWLFDRIYYERRVQFLRLICNFFLILEIIVLVQKNFQSMFSILLGVKYPWGPIRWQLVEKQVNRQPASMKEIRLVFSSAQHFRSVLHLSTVRIPSCNYHFYIMVCIE